MEGNGHHDGDGQCWIIQSSDKSGQTFREIMDGKSQGSEYTSSHQAAI